MYFRNNLGHDISQIFDDFFSNKHDTEHKKVDQIIEHVEMRGNIVHDSLRECEMMWEDREMFFDHTVMREPITPDMCDLCQQCHTYK